MAEQIILDPSEVSTNRTSLDLTPWLDQDGIDWGDASVTAFMADAQLGSVPVDYTVPNRSISAPLKLADTRGGTTPTQARAAIQAKAALIQREGGWLKRVTASGGTVYADLTNATLRATSVSGWESRQGVEIGASLELEAIPDFYEDEVTDSDNTTTTARELVFNTALAAGNGENPNRLRLVVDNDGSTDWRGLIYAFRCRHFPGATAATTAAVEYEAEELGPLDTATKVAGTAIYGTATNGRWSGGTVVHHGTLSTNWTPVLGGRIGGTTYPTHTGTYRMWARLASTSGTLVQARAVWDVGDLVLPSENDPIRLPGANNAYMVNMGEVRLAQAPVGTHRWDWQIQGKGDAGGENLSVDKVWFANTDEGYGVLSAPVVNNAGLVTYSARSEFTSESGAITGDALAVGGTWTGAGDADDFTESSDTAIRTAVSDTASFQNGRILTASTPTLAGCTVKVDAKSSLSSGSIVHGVVGRYVDANNFATALFSASTPNIQFTIYQLVAGTPALIVAAPPLQGPPYSVDTWYTIQMSCLASGLVTADLYLRGSSSPLMSIAGFSSTLATGATLDDGKVGFIDGYSGSTAATRTYDNFAAWVPSDDAVVFNGQSAQLTTQGHYREDAGGTAYGPVSVPDAALPRFPVPAQAGGTVETLLIPTAGDLDQLPDTFGTASISAQAFRRPSWLFVGD